MMLDDPVDPLQRRLGMEVEVVAARYKTCYVKGRGDPTQSAQVGLRPSSRHRLSYHKSRGWRGRGYQNSVGQEAVGPRIGC